MPKSKESQPPHSNKPSSPRWTILKVFALIIVVVAVVTIIYRFWVH